MTTPARMSLDQFLDVYVPQVLKPLGGWKCGSLGEGFVRRIVEGPFGERTSCCPLTAESGQGAMAAPFSGHLLGLDTDDVLAVMLAADGKLGPVRDRLLSGLGLAIDPSEIPF